ncbi:MAG: TonB-dependent receptor [Methylococcales symbiont of Iophon sp. n. MRB-2018]|nr:MAG: TonB-dependent receptor [Methylococcales symbiont of Iophon sp. n. MRB-2018]
MTKILRYALIYLFLLSPVAQAQAINQDSESVELEEFVVIGSRSQASRSVKSSPVPIDIISGSEVLSYGSGDLSTQLSHLIPSYNVNEQPISDAATFIRPANLRGLSPGATLVTINGKRRHRAAVITLLGGGVSNGAQGTDISTIPAIALKQVEVLRDGASAQYGSDAIAGVLNFQLKDSAEGGSVNMRWGKHYKGDGEAYNIAANIGLPLTDKGFINLSYEFSEAKPTSRSVQRDNAQELIDKGNTGVANPAQIWGSQEINEDHKLFVNTGFTLNEAVELYVFGNYAERQAENGFFFRSPGCDADGVTDTNNANDLSCSPRTGVYVNGDRLATLPAIDGFSFKDRFPNGFTPQFGGDLEDYSVAGGVRGDVVDDWHYDISGSYGRNSIDFSLKDSINPQLVTLGNNIPTEYELGSHIQTEYIYNLDLSKPVDLDFFASPLYVSFGAEYRLEQFEIVAGERNSWYVDERAEYGDNGDKTLLELGYGAGANGFVGFHPDTAGTNSRNSWAGYLELETDVIEDVLLNTAVRYENYDDFSETVNGKVALLWQASDPLALRASFNTGFRVPTVGQASLRSITTEFSGGELRDSLIAPVDDPISIANGAKALKAEQSINFSVGMVANLGDIDITVDYFHIKIEDRLALTPVQNITDNPNFSSVRYFANAFDTTTQGVDIVASYPLQWIGGDTLFSAIGNWTDTEVDKYDADIITNVRINQLERGLPEFRFSLEGKHSQGPWQFLLRGRFYDGFYEAHTDSASTIINADPRWLMDTELSYNVQKASFGEQKLTLAIGARNVFDQYPSKNPHSGNTGAKYPESSPYGFNGGFYYTSINYAF